jgi:hypothetical protein
VHLRTPCVWHTSLAAHSPRTPAPPLSQLRRRLASRVEFSVERLHSCNVLVTPSLIKNLISVRTLTRDNNVLVDFNPSGFSIKDLHTNQVTLRCNSQGDLYPLQLPAHHVLHAPTLPRRTERTLRTLNDSVRAMLLHM